MKLSKESRKSLVIYIIKCLAGTLTVFAISSLIHYKNITWSLISVLLVLSPEGKDTITIAMNRIKANVLGAGSGFLCLIIGKPEIWTICLSLAITLCLCYLCKLEIAARTALAASIIIMLHEEGTHIWNTAAERVIAVFAGCILGLIITFIFHFIYRRVVREKTSSNAMDNA